VVVAASGMVTGGRLSYLERYISLPETTVIIVGYKQKELGKLLEEPKKLRFMESIIPLKQRFVK
jgi:metallo-beta-lactamase family protein